MNRAPLPVVAANLGHADTRMCEKHYAHLAPSYVAQAIRAAAPDLDISEPSNVERLEASDCRWAQYKRCRIFDPPER